jgi:hypothetical protein
MHCAGKRFAIRRRCAIVTPETVKIEAVIKVSTARKIGIVTRVAWQQAGRSRTVRALTGAARATARSFGKVLHQLWLEVTGFVFLVMAAVGGIAFAREYGKHQGGRGRLIVAICFTLTFVWFGISSFWKVRRKKG